MPYKNANIFYIFSLFLLYQTQIFTFTQANKIKKHLFTPYNANITIDNINTDPIKLLKAAEFSLKYYFNTSNKTEKKTVESKILESQILPSAEAKKTLEFIIATIKNDITNKRKNFRISNPEFIKQHFSFIKWNSDLNEAIKNQIATPSWLSDGKIRLTGYALFRCNANYQKTKEYPHALYAIINDNFDENLRLKYSKQEILNGILEQPCYKKSIMPIAWVSRETLEEALMQGSIILQMPDKKEKLLNVYQSNGFPYDKTIKDRLLQKKYWFFKEIQSRKSRCERLIMDFVNLGNTVFAGDLENLGLGKIIALQYQNQLTRKNEIKLGILADKGSAFSNNLYQLDLFSGTFNSRPDFFQFMKQFPPSAHAFILKKKG